MALLERSFMLLAITVLLAAIVLANPNPDFADDFPLPVLGLSPPPRSRPLHVGDAATGLCSEVECLTGDASLDPTTNVCVCPKWLDQNPKDPCGFINCSETTQVQYLLATNQCICKVKHLTPVLINQATKEVPQKDADIYSVQPFFGQGIISFFVQLRGAPGGFNLNASTTIVAEGLQADTELVVVPANIKTKVVLTAENTALITAITFTAADKIDYYVTLSNGTSLKLFGDKMVHDIDLIDPAKPPTLSLTTHKARSLSKRSSFSVSQPRGIEMIGSGQVVTDAMACERMKCTLNGQPAHFNEFHQACYCKTPDAPNTVQRRVAGATSLEVCEMMLSCDPPSEAYLHAESKQCACVIWREGVSRPIIVSDPETLSDTAAQPAARPRDPSTSSAMPVLSLATWSAPAALAPRKKHPKPDFSVACPALPLFEPWCQKPPRKYSCHGPYLLRDGSYESQPCQLHCKCEQQGGYVLECPGFPLFEPWCMDQPRGYRCGGEDGRAVVRTKGGAESQQCGTLCTCVKKVVKEAIGG